MEFPMINFKSIYIWTQKVPAFEFDSLSTTSDRNNSRTAIRDSNSKRTPGIHSKVRLSVDTKEDHLLGENKRPEKVYFGDPQWCYFIIWLQSRRRISRKWISDSPRRGNKRFYSRTIQHERRHRRETIIRLFRSSIRMFSRRWLLRRSHSTFVSDFYIASKFRGLSI